MSKQNLIYNPYAEILLRDCVCFDWEFKLQFFPECHQLFLDFLIQENNYKETVYEIRMLDPDIEIALYFDRKRIRGVIPLSVNFVELFKFASKLLLLGRIGEC